jgi:hypothetical protein
MMGPEIGGRPRNNSDAKGKSKEPTFAQSDTIVKRADESHSSRQTPGHTTLPNGFEVIGLALAIFPLINTSLKTYLEGGKNIKDLAGLRRSINKVASNIEAKHACYEQTCVKLVDGLISVEEVAYLMQGTGWEDPNLHDVLESNLGPHTTRAFLNLTWGLVGSLRAVMEEFSLNGPEVRTIARKIVGKLS